MEGENLRKVILGWWWDSHIVKIGCSKETGGIDEGGKWTIVKWLVLKYCRPET